MCSGETKDDTADLPVDVHSRNLQKGQGAMAMDDDNIGFLEQQKIKEEFNRECISEDGSVYVGDKLNGMRHGHGTLTWPDGSVYSGGWK